MTKYECLKKSAVADIHTAVADIHTAVADMHTAVQRVQENNFPFYHHPEEIMEK